MPAHPASVIAKLSVLQVHLTTSRRLFEAAAAVVARSGSVVHLALIADAIRQHDETVRQVLPAAEEYADAIIAAYRAGVEDTEKRYEREQEGGRTHLKAV